MTRALTTAASAAVQAEVVTRTCAVELLFDSGAVRFNCGFQDISIGGNSFPGLGPLAALGAVEESWELQSNGMSVSLSGIPRDAVALALTEAYQNRPATIWEVLIDHATGQVIADPIIVFRGRMNQMNVQLGDQAVVEITLEDHLTEMDQPALSRNTDEDQRRDFPGDFFFSFVPATNSKEVIWPARSFRG